MGGRGVHQVDLHLHSTVSDGTDSPEAFLQLARDHGLSVFSITDHDAIQGCVRVRDQLAKEYFTNEVRTKEGSTNPELRFLSGIEISCKDTLGRYHILGYGYDPDSPVMRSFADKVHEMRMEKVRRRLHALDREYGMPFSERDVQALLARSNPGKPHIGNLMVRYGYAKTRDEAISQILNHIHVKGDVISPQEAIGVIRSGGGIPVLAHPSFGSGNQFLTGEAMEQRIRHLLSLGLEGIEAYYSGFSPALIGELHGYAAQFDLLVTAGSDYHGKNKTVPFGQTHLADAENDDRVMKFLERVGVLLQTAFGLSDASFIGAAAGTSPMANVSVSETPQ